MRISTGGKKCCNNKGEEGSQKGREPYETKPGPGHRHLHAVECSKLGVCVTLPWDTVKRHYVQGEGKARPTGAGNRLCRLANRRGPG